MDHVLDKLPGLEVTTVEKWLTLAQLTSANQSGELVIITNNTRHLPTQVKSRNS